MGCFEGTRAVRTAVSGRHMLRTAFFGTFLQDSAVRGRCTCPTLFSVIRNIGQAPQDGWETRSAGDSWSGVAFCEALMHVGAACADPKSPYNYGILGP